MNIKDFNTASKIKMSAGVAITCKNRLLMVRSTNLDMWSIPKGGIEKSEKDPLDAALRELKEETSLILKSNMIVNPNNPDKIEYKSSMGGTKLLYIYSCPISSYAEIGMDRPSIDVDFLQLKEIDVAMFVDREIAEDLIIPAQKELLKYVKF